MSATTPTCRAVASTTWALTMWSPMRCKELTALSMSTISAGLGRQRDARWPRNTSPDFWDGPLILPLPIELAGAGSAPAVRVTDLKELRAALDVLGLDPPRPTVIVVGGANYQPVNRE